MGEFSFPKPPRLGFCGKLEFLKQLFKSTGCIKLKSLVQLFKAAGSPEGEAFKHPVFKHPSPLAAGGDWSQAFYIRWVSFSIR